MMGQIGRRRLKHMAYFPHNIFAEFWYCTGGYRARTKASKGRVKSTSLSLEMLRKQIPLRKTLPPVSPQDIYQIFKLCRTEV